MTREIKATALMIQRARRDWYAWHYENYKKAQALPASLAQAYISASGYISRPQMTIFGGLPQDWPERKAYELAHTWKLDIHLINPWYFTEWDQFQALWQQLPEPVDICTQGWVQIGHLSTLSTMPSHSQPPT